MSDNEQTADDTVFETQIVAGKKYWGMDEKTFCVLLHLAQFAHVVPMGGFIIPLVMWLTNKEESKIIDEHGKHVMNWLISEFIYMLVLGFVSAFLGFVIFIGLMVMTHGHAAPVLFPLMFMAYIPLLCLSLLGVIFPIVGAVKANKGICWQYPFAIPFIK